MHVYFNDFDFETISGLRVLNRAVHTIPKRDIVKARLAFSNESSFGNVYDVEKQIRIDCVIGLNSRNEMEMAYDTLLANIQANNGRLELERAGELRRWIATMSNVEVDKSVQGGLMQFTIVFDCSDPISIVPNLITHDFDGIITDTEISPFTLLGNYFIQPIITITVNSITDGEAKTVTITNPSTERAIDINRTWEVGDVIEIDASNKTVKANGTIVDYGGYFPEWLPGSGSISYGDDFTDRDIDLTFSYYKRYL